MADVPIGQNPAQAYEEYFVRYIFLPWTQDLLERAAPRPGERVLDIACGTGIVARTMARRLGPDARIVGLDLNPAMLEVARTVADADAAAIEWRQGNAESLPFADASFDLALCQQGLQFIPDRRAAAQEMHRVLAPGGRAAVSVWGELAWLPVYEALWTSAARHLGVPVAVVASAFSVSEGELRDIFTTAGFESVEIATVSRDVRFPSSQGFVERTLASVAAVVPTLAAMTSGARAELAAAIGAEIDPVLQAHLRGERLVFPMCAFVTVARR